jgi:hypothetical protein
LFWLFGVCRGGQEPDRMDRSQILGRETGSGDGKPGQNCLIFVLTRIRLWCFEPGNRVKNRETGSELFDIRSDPLSPF